ncbi:MAG: YigZ family protein [Clostridia bacterium]|nr:YigZ family protein [Clostridia bacterium]
MPDKNYLTIAKEGMDEFVERKSRFMGFIKPVTTEEEALNFIREKQKKYWDATHNVYAYVLEGGNLCRFSDDGEPQGTAGIPVLDVLRKEGLTDCVVVVTRYFGGILLGAGGLVRAYSHGAKIAVDAGGVVEMRRCLLGEIVCDYAQYGMIPSILADCGATLTDTEFGEAVTVGFSIPREGQGSLEAAVIDRSNGRLSAVFAGEEWVPCPVERHKK